MEINSIKNGLKSESDSSRVFTTGSSAQALVGVVLLIPFTGAQNWFAFQSNRLFSHVFAESFIHRYTVIYRYNDINLNIRP